MSFFEDELRKILGEGSPVRDTRFIGRCCVGRLGDTTNAKLEFVTAGIYQRYEGIKAGVFNRNEGPIDSGVFFFADIFGDKPGTYADNPPHVRIRDGKAEWHAYKPNDADYAAIAAAVNSYLEVFLEPAELTRNAEKPAAGRSDGCTSVLEAIKADKAKPRNPRSKAAGAKTKDGAEL